jgi:hypothetical protein
VKCHWTLKQRYYPLDVKISRLTLGIDKVSINSRFVNSVQFSLVTKEICLAQRPSLSYRQAIQLIADFQQSLVLFSEPFVNFPLSV